MIEFHPLRRENAWFFVPSCENIQANVMKLANFKDFRHSHKWQEHTPYVHPQCCHFCSHRKQDVKRALYKGGGRGRENFPRSPGKVTLSNLEQIHLAPWMFSPLLRLMSWKAFLKQCYTRKGGGGESNPRLCVRAIVRFVFSGSSRVLYPLYERDFLVKKKIRMSAAVSGLPKQVSSHVSSVSVNFAKVTVWTRCQERRCWYAPRVRGGDLILQTKTKQHGNQAL